MARPKPRLAKPTLTASVPARTNATTATFTFSSPTATKYTCSLDGKKTTCTSPKTYTALAERAHAFAVVATRTGARASQPASFAWTVDRTAPPAVTFTGVPTAPAKAANAPDIKFLAGEANDTFSCRVDNGAPFACSANTAGSTHTPPPVFPPPPPPPQATAPTLSLSRRPMPRATSDLLPPPAGRSTTSDPRS